MSTITVDRPDVTSDDVAAALRRGLGPRYNVLTGVAVNWNPFGKPRPDHQDAVVVGTGSNRLFRAQVKISHHSGTTTLHVSPGGIGWPRVTNRLGIVRKALGVLHDVPSLR